MHLFIKLQIENIEISTSPFKKNVHFVPWYGQKQSITTVRRKFKTKHQMSPSARTNMLGCIENVNNPGIGENRTGRLEDSS